MVSPKLRSRSYRKIHVRLPSGKSVIHYERKKNNTAKCQICGKELFSVDTNKITNLSKSEKRPNRIFGGVLCHECVETLIKQVVRGTL
ncbi:50S ribosomal protein L34e [Acidianus sulfidivorans JP7]|uniref:Large ribosomal subunit protein eL34 n=1 Tax=Acidianus sulfidivorans JP7 TaxID=619593 RepID=A0A2U9IMS4_9CREN|nr:50S ribosomal protein L34e [Acidianus sulfidivorans]AWR97306.1 50S ribosomal protein L34e [Acidianus sulfidivorans JP7]